MTGADTGTWAPSPTSEGTTGALFQQFPGLFESFQQFFFIYCFRRNLRGSVHYKAAQTMGATFDSISMRTSKSPDGMRTKKPDEPPSESRYCILGLGPHVYVLYRFQKGVPTHCNLAELAHLLRC